MTTSLSTIEVACDVIRIGYAEMQANLDVLAKLVKAVEQTVANQHPQLVDAMKDANNLISGLERK